MINAIQKPRRVPLCMAALGLALGVALALPAQDETPTASKRLRDYNLPGLDVKVNLTSLEPWDVVKVIDFLAFKGGLDNIVIGRGVVGLTTKLKFSNVSVGDALEVVLSVNNLAYEVKSGIVTIMTDEEYKSLYGRSFYDHKQVRIVDLKYADATRVAQMLASVKSSIGTVVADPVTGTLVLIDTPEKIEEMRTVVEKADISTVSRVIPTETKTYVLQYANIEDVQPQIQDLVSKEAGTLKVDKRTKTMVVTDLPHNVEKIDEVVWLFDRRPKQVFVEAKVVEVRLDDRFMLGINWEHMFQNLDPRFSLQTASKPMLFPNAGVGTLDYKTIDAGGNLDVIISTLKEIGETKILSNPQVAVLDGQEASIEVIEDQPYKEVTLEAGTTNITGVTYLFKKVGVILAVTPRINDERMITMDIKPEISSISQWYDGAPQEGTPVIKKSLAETTVSVKDGVTIIIGGMIKNEKGNTTRQIPLLGSIPLLGTLFKYRVTQTINTETVVFLTPRIVTGEEPYLRMDDVKKPTKPLRRPVRGGESRETASAAGMGKAGSTSPAGQISTSGSVGKP